MVRRKALPSQERLKTLLSYDLKTGIFVWREARSPKTKIGMRAGITSSNRYVAITIDYEPFQAHRLAWKYCFDEEPMQIDHKNGDKTDNRLENLRVATQSQNRANSRVQTQRKFDLPKGVVPAKKCTLRPYQAQIYVKGKRKILGFYPSIEEAKAAYQAAAVMAYGEFARF